MSAPAAPERRVEGGPSSAECLVCAPDACIADARRPAADSPAALEYAAAAVQERELLLTRLA